ncbi:MAG: hypothetical protein K1W41_11555 [Lachnospiraceae bacterium]
MLGYTFMRGALEGAVKGGAYNIADVLDNKLRNAYGSGNRRNPGTRNPWNKDKRNPWNSRNPRPTGSRCPQSDCIRPKPLKGMRNPKRRGSGGNSSRNTTHRNDRFSLGSFVRDVVSGAVMGGLASVVFYGAGKAVEALKRGVQEKHRKSLAHDRNGLYSIGNIGHKVNLEFLIQNGNYNSVYSILYC